MNRFQPHVVVIPEDGANRQIANGFILQLPSAGQRRIQILPEVGGWAVVRSQLIQRQAELGRYPHRRIVGLLDFDNQARRRSEIMSSIDASVKDRVFILGARGEPEELKREKLGDFEAIGKGLASDCMRGTSELWGHPLLVHNAEEVARMQADIGAFLFPRD